LLCFDLAAKRFIRLQVLCTDILFLEPVLLSAWLIKQYASQCNLLFFRST
jgi:hypothetical protein